LALKKMPPMPVTRFMGLPCVVVVWFGDRSALSALIVHNYAAGEHGEPAASEADRSRLLTFWYDSALGPQNHLFG
jgi:hypothetical protein